MEENRNAYSEVIEILKYIDDEEKLEKLPMEMLEVLKSKMNPEYKPVISMEIPLEEQNLQPETYSILSWIAMKYWSEEPNKEQESDVMAENAKIQEAIQNREEVAYENVQENVQKIEEEIDTKVEKVEKIEGMEEQKEQKEQAAEDTSPLLPIVHSDLKWYERIKIKIIEIFNKLLRRSKIKEERGNA